MFNNKLENHGDRCCWLLKRFCEIHQKLKKNELWTFNTDLINRANVKHVNNHVYTRPI